MHKKRKVTRVKCSSFLYSPYLIRVISLDDLPFIGTKICPHDRDERLYCELETKSRNKEIQKSLYFIPLDALAQPGDLHQVRISWLASESKAVLNPAMPCRNSWISKGRG